MAEYDTIIIGAGAAGLMCAIEAGKRGRRVLLIDHAKAPGEKIRISGGGRCNFTNIHASPKNFISKNPHFCKSALSRYTPADFIDLVNAHSIAWHEKTLGQLFCDHSAKDIIAMLTDECAKARVDLRLNVTVDDVRKTDTGFQITTNAGRFTTQSLVIATGGKSIPKMGATDFAYRIARQFDIDLVETRPALVPLTFSPDILAATKPLSGVSTDARVQCNGAIFDEAMLFTHRGISGPSILQISSYWREGDEIDIDLAPENDCRNLLKIARDKQGKATAHSIVSAVLPKRLAEKVCEFAKATGKIGEFSNARIDALANAIHQWRVKPVGSEGYRTAEVTLGGVNTNALSSKTLEVNSVPGLYFIGEAVDVTGWLGGYNFQWAWSSGWAAGQAV